MSDSSVAPSGSLEGKVVVVTGGAGFLGRAFVDAIATNGGTAVVADINMEAATRVASAVVSASGGGAFGATLDITSAESIDGLIAEVIRERGRIDAVVNNAYPRNSAYGRRVEDVTYADFCENVSLHLGGYFLSCQRFSRCFERQGYGNIVNIASIYGVVAPRFEIYDGTPMTMPVEYAAIKAGLLHLTRYLAQYLKGRGIRVNAISPGGLLAGQPEEFLEAYNAFASSKGMLDPQDVAGTLVFLLSDASRYVNGQNIIVDDGWSL